MLNKITVFCGSSSGKGPKYLEAARALGQQLVKENVGLVYGGGSVGLMGAIASEVGRKMRYYETPFLRSRDPLSEIKILGSWGSRHAPASC